MTKHEIKIDLSDAGDCSVVASYFQRQSYCFNSLKAKRDLYIICDTNQSSCDMWRNIKSSVWRTNDFSTSTTQVFSFKFCSNWWWNEIELEQVVESDGCLEQRFVLHLLPNAMRRPSTFYDEWHVDWRAIFMELFQLRSDGTIDFARCCDLVAHSTTIKILARSCCVTI